MLLVHADTESYSFLITVGINTAASRLAWGMATDGALPFSKTFSTINRTFQTPLNAIFLIVAAEVVIGMTSLDLFVYFILTQSRPRCIWE